MSEYSRIKIIPATVSDIEHRSECLPYYDAFWSTDADAWCLAGAHLPIFTAPMASIVNDKNYLDFDRNSINTIIPRTVSYERRLEIAKQLIWIAVGLDEFRKFIDEHDSLEDEYRICVDVANGHMKKLIDMCAEAKNKFGENLILMTGNIANPNTYLEYAKAGIDYIRLGIGTGSVCATTDLTGIHFDPIELILSCRNRKFYVENNIKNFDGIYKSIPKIVADGGVDSISDIIKALAIGADYVMCGSLFAACEEACGETRVIRTPVKFELGTVAFKDETYRKHYGMSTEKAQKEMGNTKIKLSEGKEKWIEVNNTLPDFEKQFVAAISSTMSYCGKRTLEEFIGNVSYR